MPFPASQTVEPALDGRAQRHAEAQGMQVLVHQDQSAALHELVLFGARELDGQCLARRGGVGRLLVSRGQRRGSSSTITTTTTSSSSTITTATITTTSNRLGPRFL